MILKSCSHAKRVPSRTTRQCTSMSCQTRVGRTQVSLSRFPVAIPQQPDSVCPGAPGDQGGSGVGPRWLPRRIKPAIQQNKFCATPASLSPCLILLSIPTFLKRMWRLLKEFLLFARQEKKWWLIPLVVVLLLLGAILIFASSSGIAWALYPFF